MKKILLISFHLLIIQLIYCQADISLSTHWFNRANYNPASIARPNYIYLFSNVRQQWMNLPGSPQTLNIQASLYNSKYKSAFGISLISDQIGISQAINPMLTYAYRISNNENTAVSFGVSAGLFGINYNGTLLDPVENDPTLVTEINRYFKPDVNLGIEFQTKYFIAGISSTHILSIKNIDSLYLNSNHRYAYITFKNTNSEILNLYAGIMFINRNNLNVWEINSSVRFKQPTGLVSGSRELFDIGLSYRNTKQTTLLFGWNISDNFRIGYAYDQSFNIGFAHNGSHEIMLEFRIPLNSATCIPCRDIENSTYWYR